jgi:outer membrane biogenesis lipoprotein LolB
MKNSLMILLAGAMLTLVGCSKKDSGNPITPNTPTPQQTNVTFTMHMESGTQGMIFVASPNVDVKLTKIEVSFPAGNFSETITNPNPNTVIPKNSNVQFAEYTGIETHQQWVLKFYGMVAATGEAFTVTVNWDVV